MRRFRYGILSGVGLAPLLAGAAVAQDGPAQATVEAVVVTGSRLQSGFSAPTPVTVVGAQLFERRAATNVADVLNDLPTFRNSTSPSQSQRTFGRGQNNVDLRGLGTTRTLLLVDGARVTPTNPNGNYDLNLIPSGLIDRVDIVTGGASAAYGSDAVAGVVNVVLKDRLEGFQGTLQYGASDQGDNEEPLASLAYGRTFAEGRGRLILGGEYAENSGVGRIYTRDWGRRLPGLIAFGATRPAGLPSQGFATGVTYSQQSADGVVTAGPLRGLSFAPGGVGTYAFDYGQVYSSLMIGGTNVNANPFGNWPLITPNTRGAAIARLSYDLSPSIKATAQLAYGRTTGTGYTSYNQANFTIDRNNAFLPASVRSQMVAANVQTIQVGKILTELGGLQQYNKHEDLQGRLALAGSLGDWKWDAYYAYGKSKSYESILENTLVNNYAAAVAAVTDASGRIVCAPLESNPNVPAARRALVQPGCVPINIFGFGSPSREALAYIGETSYDNTTLTRSSGAFNVRGAPIQSWAGPIDVAVGLEYRRDTLSDVADPLGAQQLFGSGNRSDYSGEVSVYEGYGEVGVPLARDLPLAKSLDLNAAGRRTHYSSSGWVTTWKVGLTYEPVDSLRFRLARSRDIRAPNLNELYQRGGAGVGVASAVNPINGRTGPLVTQASGNLNLTPEIADTYTAGLVFEPSWTWARGFHASVDYFDITVKDVIASVAALDILRRCGAGRTEYCDAVTFDNSPFGVAVVRTKPFNLSELSTNGLDIELAYGAELRDLGLGVPGRLDIRALGTKVWDRITTDEVGSVDRAGSAQGGGVPDWTWNLDFTYRLDRFTGSLNFRYTSPLLYDATLVGPDSPSYSPTLSNSINDNQFPSALYASLSAQYDLLVRGDRRLQIFGVVNNVMDQKPPVFAAIAINSGGDPFDLVGRRYRFGVRFRY